MSRLSGVTIRTVGQAELGEDIIFSSRDLNIGDWVDLKPTKPEDAPVYGRARVTGFERWVEGEPVLFKAQRLF